VTASAAESSPVKTAKNIIPTSIHMYANPRPFLDRGTWRGGGIREKKLVEEVRGGGLGGAQTA
jgi:hypothetical protein